MYRSYRIVNRIEIVVRILFWRDYHNEFLGRDFLIEIIIRISDPENNRSISDGQNAQVEIFVLIRSTLTNFFRLFPIIKSFQLKILYPLSFKTFIFPNIFSFTCSDREKLSFLICCFGNFAPKSNSSGCKS